MKNEDVMNIAKKRGFLWSSFEIYSGVAGFFDYGPLGAILATISLVLPGLIIIVLIARALEKFRENQLVQNIFSGLRPAVVGMIAVSATSVLENAFFLAGTDFSSFSLGALDWRNILLFFVLLFAVFKWKKHPILYIAIGAVVGILFQF